MQGNVLIVGGGIAGLSAGIALQRLGYQVELAEKVTQWAPAGAGIILQANALAILQALGLKQAVVARGLMVPGVELRDERGNVLIEGNSSDIGEVLTIHRGALHQVLLHESDQLDIHLGETVNELIDRGSGGVEVSFSSGRKANYELVVGADGLHSVTRQLLPSNEREIAYRDSEQLCWRVVVPNITGQQNAVELWGRQKRVGLIPLADGQLYIFLVKSHRPQLGVTSKNVPLNVRDFDEFALGTATLLDQISGSDKVIFNPLGDIAVNWGSGRVLLIGDAAHAMTPNMGQGAAMALEDVAALVSILKTCSLDEAVAEMTRQRSERVGQFRQQSFRFGKLAHTPSATTRFVRNGVLKILPQSMMAKSMEKLYIPGMEAANAMRLHFSS